MSLPPTPSWQTSLDFPHWLSLPLLLGISPFCLLEDCQTQASPSIPTYLIIRLGEPNQSLSWTHGLALLGQWARQDQSKTFSGTDRKLFKENQPTLPTDKTWTIEMMVILNLHEINQPKENRAKWWRETFLAMPFVHWSHITSAFSYTVNWLSSLSWFYNPQPSELRIHSVLQHWTLQLNSCRQLQPLKALCAICRNIKYYISIALLRPYEQRAIHYAENSYTIQLQR